MRSGVVCRQVAASALVLTALATAGAESASAGVLEGEPGNVLRYRHLPTIEDHRAHDVQVQLVAGGQYRISDRGTDIFICGVDVPASGCGPAPCVRGATAAEALCPTTAVVQLIVQLGDLGDRLLNDAALQVAACGGAGSDVLSGGSGVDLLAGGPGRDEVYGRAGRDTLAVDTRVGCPGGDPEQLELLDGGPGFDLIQGGPGADLVRGGADDDRAFGAAGNDRLEGGDGRDELLGLAGADLVTGSSGADFLFGGPGNDELSGGPGDDDLGRTVRYDSDGGDASSGVVVSEETGDDRLSGDEGDDTLTAGPGETLYDAIDPLSLLTGGIFQRILLSAVLNGADRFAGGAGTDTVSYVNRDRPVAVTLDGLANDGSAGERDGVDADVEQVRGGARDDLLQAAPSGSSLFGDLGRDVLIGAAGPDSLSGGDDEGSDRLAGAGGADRLRGGPGDDALDGGTGADAVLGQGGDDGLSGGAGGDTIEGGAGADQLDGGPDDDCLHGFVVSGPGDRQSPCPAPNPGSTVGGADGADLLRGGAGTDHLRGGDSEDVADFSGARRRVVVALPGARGARSLRTHVDILGADIEGVRGGSGHDLLIGNALDNVLDGGRGDDQIEGGLGIDRLRGGSGRDLLVARDGRPDALRCGTKRDLAQVDGEDEIVAALSDVCEQVDGGGSRLEVGAATVGPARACLLPVRVPGTARPFLLRRWTAVPGGTTVDASSCAARLRGGGVLRGGAAGLVGRGRGVRLRLQGRVRPPCPRSGIGRRRLEIIRAGRGLVVSGRGLVARGTGASWTTLEGCRGTTVLVGRGRVRLFDRVRSRTLVLAARGRHFVPGARS